MSSLHSSLRVFLLTSTWFFINTSILFSQSPEVFLLDFSDDTLYVEPLSGEGFHHLRICITSPDDRLVFDTTSFGEPVAWVSRGTATDGIYRFEVTALSEDGSRQAESSDGFPEEEGRASKQKKSGWFRVQAGRILSPQVIGVEGSTEGRSSSKFLHSTRPPGSDFFLTQTFSEQIRVSDSFPTYRFDDTDVTEQTDEWVIRAQQQDAPNALPHKFDLYDDIHNNEVLEVYASNNNAQSLVVDENGDLRLANGNFFFDRSSGSMGIGDTGPFNADLSIHSGSPTIRLEDTNSAGGSVHSANSRARIFLSEDYVGISTLTWGDVTFPSLLIWGVSKDYPLVVRSQASDPRSEGEGFVGIGTYDPAAKLHVSGGNTAKVLVENTSGPESVRTQFQLKNYGAPRFALENVSKGIEWSFQQSTPGNFLISKEGSGGPELQIYTTGRVRMGPGGASRFDLSPNGNLTITGSLTASGSTFPDYVFDPGYDLMALADLRTFIEREQRLPNIPSAKDVEQQGGHNMTELQLKLLRKIEELTLYTLEQEKKLEAVIAENVLVKKELRKIRTKLSEVGQDYQ